MDVETIKTIVDNQREYFLKGETLDYSFRINALKKLRKSLIDNKEIIYKAFLDDFNKSKFDVLSTEFGMAIEEIDYMIKHLKTLMKPKKVKTSLFNFPSKGYIYSEPYGVSLIIAPWNYPLQLSIAPLAGAIAGGNTVILKPSSYASNVSLALEKVLSVFDDKYIATILGGRNEISALLDQKFDYIFFTGSPTVGKIVMEKASKNLTPISLELGGKSPTIIDEDADINIAAKRITWGKFLNAGQTCVAPDYILVHKKVHKEFVKKVIEYIKMYYYDNGKIRSDFPYIINKKHFDRLNGLIDDKKIAFGGNSSNLLIEPTVLDNITFSDKVMGEEIFGPIMPIIEFNDLNELINEQKRLPKPLALYYFGNNKHNIEKVLNNISSGGACINEVVMHLTNDDMPFGGVGNSGMGSYHGKKSFETFTHQKSVLKKGKIEINVKYPPTNENKEKLVTKLMKVK
ncbi:MAG TPA: aldehyde dehydrogenase [Firmicutes bacterium]|nr:aldehyde dehydrogenase [Bacillota bacterium]